MAVTIGFLLSCLLPLADNMDLKKEDDGVVYSPQRAFRIPLDLTDAERRTVSAIRLYVSEDQGKTWFRHSDGAPDTRVVTFRATKDGSYWFSIALVGRDGKQSPADIKTVDPGLRVVVDTTAPNLTLKPVRSKSGKRGVRWEVVDENIDFQSLRLAAWEESGTAWKAVPVRHPERALVWFEDNQNVEKLQAIIKDRAGNQSIQQVDIVGDRFTKHTPTTFALGDGNPPGASAVQQTSAQQPTAAKPPQLIKQASALLPENDTGEIQRASALMPVQHTVQSPRQPVNVPATVQGTARARTDRKISLCGTDPIVVNYEVDETGSGPVTKVELWGTRDRGQTWVKLATDNDNISPIEAIIEQDGIWGLRVVVSSDTSGVDQPPRSGTEPDTFIEVDRTSPVIEMREPEVQRGQVQLQWVAADKNLSSTPITVLLAQRPEGPWTAVAQNLENTGEFLWNFARTGLTGRYYFRIEARDDAGNVNAVTTPAPISLDNPQPKGRVLDVQSRSAQRNSRN